MARRFALTTAFSLTLAAAAVPLASTAALAQQDQVSPAIDTAPNSAIAKITADNVYVRSGAGDNYYPVAKLNTGNELTVVGAKFDWLKVVPPQGTFSYVAKAFVDKAADGQSGTVNRDDVNVRAGGELNAMKTTVQSKLANGQQVKILGEVDEYYKIAPPTDAYVYVNQKHVELVKRIPGSVAQQQPAPASPAAGEATAAGEQKPAPTSPDLTPEPVRAEPVAQQDQPAAPATEGATAAAPPATQPAGEGATAAGPATTQPVSAEAEFDKLEADFTAASNKPIEQQPVAELLGSYTKLVGNPQLPESMRRIADFRVQTLKVRSTAREEFLAVQKQQQESVARRQALKAEQEEIAQQIKQHDVQVYIAVGTLRTSSLQFGQQMLYRLTDPSTGRTVCYIRSDDPKYGQALGQFIGVKGELSTDPNLQLKVVTPTDYSPVDQNELYRKVAAQIVPPSLVPQAQQASATSGGQN